MGWEDWGWNLDILEFGWKGVVRDFYFENEGCQKEGLPLEMVGVQYKTDYFTLILIMVLMGEVD